MFSPVISAQSRAMAAGRRHAPDPFTLPAPYGGWNARDAKTEMKPNEAIVLDNFIPDFQGVQQRRGFAQHATGIAGSFVESLMP